MRENKKMLLWLLIPFIYGYVSNTFLLFINPILIQIIFTILWFWVGMKFSGLSGNKLKNYLIGNSIWFISLLLYIWQFILLDDESRVLFLAAISQYYVLSFIWSGVQLSLLFTDIIHGITITILSFLVMLVVFTLGFIVGRIFNK